MYWLTFHNCHLVAYVSSGYMSAPSLFYALMRLTNLICRKVISNEFDMLSNDNKVLVCRFGLLGVDSLL